jgi:mannosyltransferase OCH1-like enzyme
MKVWQLAALAVFICSTASFLAIPRLKRLENILFTQNRNGRLAPSYYPLEIFSYPGSSMQNSTSNKARGIMLLHESATENVQYLRNVTSADTSLQNGSAVKLISDSSWHGAAKRADMGPQTFTPTPTLDTLVQMNTDIETHRSTTSSRLRLNLSNAHSNSTPKLLHLIHITPMMRDPYTIPDEVNVTITEWTRLHPNWTVCTWTNYLVREHFPEIVPLLERISVPAWISDIVRYAILARYGGVYVDTGMYMQVCICM